MRISRTIRSGMNKKISLLALFVPLEESEIDCLAARLYSSSFLFRVQGKHVRLLVLVSMFNIPSATPYFRFQVLTPLAYPKIVVPISSYPVFLLAASFIKVSN